MMSMVRARNTLRRMGYNVDDSFRPSHGGPFCLGWKQIEQETVRTVFSDGSVWDSQTFTYPGSTLKSTVDYFYEPGHKFPVITKEE